MKRVLLYLGMGSCVSAGDQRSEDPHPSLRVIKWSSVSTKSNTAPTSAVMGRAINVQTPICEAAGIKEEMFFDSKPWLESDDEDFVSVNGDVSPVKQGNNNGDHQGRKLCELFLEGSFGSDSQTSLKANAEAISVDQKPAKMMKVERKKSAKRCLPSLVRSLSCGDRKKRLSPVHIAVVG